MNNPDSNIACLTRAADLEAAIKHHLLEVKCLSDIASYYTMSNLFDQSLEYYRKYLRLSEQHHFIVHVDNLYENLATIYGFIFSAGGGEIYLDSVEWAEHISIRYAAQTKDTNSLVFAYSNLANVHLN